jgi:formate C-acetyltransferase/4-hydroxyphenylacetate decarboxylase large subunit
VVNALSTVKQLVDEERACTLDELRAACSANWEGHEELHRRALAAPKWGNNDDRVDAIYLELFEAYCDLVSRQTNYLGKPYDPSMLAISTHTPFGKACLATPDGRCAGESLCDGVTSPQPGTDTNGPLSVLLSAGKVDHTRIRGGLHNLKLHPSALRGTEGARKLVALIRTYFESTGFQLQFNVVDTRMLRDAQVNPQNYRDLIVRVAGFSAFFVELSRSIQDQIIARTEHGL